MEQPPTVAEFYAGKTVFLTGGSGFIGKTVVEKLLRCSPDVMKIFLLLREKKNQTPVQRLEKLLEAELFDTLKAENPSVFDKLFLVPGDITEERLGLSDQDRHILTDNVHVIIHVAASINFTEPLSNALRTNVFAVKDVIDLCNECKNLEALVHCSTGFVKVDIKVIEEKLYEFKTDYKKTIELAQSISETTLEEMASQLLGDTPNTYIYTKLMAECLLADEAKHLPLAIVRPTLVVPMWKDDPICGWVDSIAHVNGMSIVVGKGYARALMANSEKAVDLIPVDLVSNVLITSAWKLGTSRGDEIDVYNVSSSCIKRVTWGRLTSAAERFYTANPLKNPIRSPFVYLVKHVMMKLINKLHTFTEVMSYFSLREWYWKTDNTRRLESEMSPADARIYPLLPTKLLWDSYLADAMKGIRKYLLKESSEEEDDARKKIAKIRRLTRFIQLLALVFASYLMFRLAHRLI